MKYLKFIYFKLFFAYKVLIWIIQSVKCRIRIKENKKESFDNYEKVIVLAPHADDEWIGCSEIIKLFKNIEIIFLNFTGSNNLKENKKIRKNEIINLCESMKVKVHIIEDDIEESLTKIINLNTPNLICLPYFIDWHEEHRKVNLILQKTINKNISITLIKHIKICSYNISIPIPGAEITNVLSMNLKTLIYKWLKFKKHYVSQKNMPIFRFICNEFINGAYCKSLFADSFSIKEFYEWNDFINKNKIKNFDILKKYINDINKIHLLINDYIE